MIRFDCPNCGKALSVPDEFAGKKGKCSGCNSKTLIPQPTAVAGPVAQLIAPSPIAAKTEVIQSAREIDCVFCGEPVKENAKKCRHCGEILDVTLRAANERSSQFAAPAVAPIHISNVVQQTTVVHRGERWNRGIAMLLSFFIPGLGQLYKGQPINGAVWFVLVVIGYIALIIPGVILHFCCIIGAGMGRND